MTERAPREAARGKSLTFVVGLIVGAALCRLASPGMSPMPAANAQGSLGPAEIGLRQIELLEKSVEQLRSQTALLERLVKRAEGARPPPAGGDPGDPPR